MADTSKCNQLFTVAGTQQEALTPVRPGAPQGALDKADTFERLVAAFFFGLFLCPVVRTAMTARSSGRNTCCPTDPRQDYR
jgi:hypothetical protein